MNGTGRSGTGRLRNFKAMSDEKLTAVFWEVIGEADDPEARDALFAEIAARGLGAGLDLLGEDDGDLE
jgi:hypothetical protein